MARDGEEVTDNTLEGVLQSQRGQRGGGRAGVAGGIGHAGGAEQIGLG